MLPKRSRAPLEEVFYEAFLEGCERTLLITLSASFAVMGIVKVELFVVRLV